ncbi:MAG: DUF3696 domain-containing protein [Fluviicoccus sp.]|uniref:DUF3696 domain-containing protein n=1 Tax=Fluviicoccus sp. TaxID=2003552 RepID=UPI00272895B1|nr:DUF3696 domain-containing protein [Fluviicoccus sp.]MDO8332143.1 DUF3696 domain-containing protein [Fluviicoccus sp.]
MPMLESIRVRNLRGISDSGSIEMKPITVLVGRNSSGKSTFARVLPLLRQSIEAKKKGPILWFGPMVDFGTFNNSVNRISANKVIEFDFSIRLFGDVKNGQMFDYYQRGFSPRLASDCLINVSVRVESNDNDNDKGSFASNIKFELFGNECEVVFNGGDRIKSIKANGYMWEPKEGAKTIVTQGALLPKISFIKQVSQRLGDTERKVWVQYNPLFDQLVDRLRIFAHGRTYRDTVEQMARYLFISDRKTFLHRMSELPGSPYSFMQTISLLKIGSLDFERVNDAFFAAAIPSLLDRIDSAIEACMSGVRYIEPLRATAQRYYRRQDLAVDEIDPKGNNVAVFVDSLDSNYMSDLNEWLGKYFGFHVAAKKSEGHIALAIKSLSSTSEEYTNMADLGVGYSQVLPIAIQLWMSSDFYFNGRRRSHIKGFFPCVVIEQPELHLHPAYQAQIADVLGAALERSREQEVNFTVFVETHSPNLINRLGQLIESGKIRTDDVQVLMFEQDEDNGATKISKSVFDDSGVLLNWPYGFFEA